MGLENPRTSLRTVRLAPSHGKSELGGVIQWCPHRAQAGVIASSVGTYMLLF